MGQGACASTLQPAQKGRPFETHASNNSVPQAGTSTRLKQGPAKDQLLVFNTLRVISHEDSLFFHAAVSGVTEHFEKFILELGVKTGACRGTRKASENFLKIINIFIKERRLARHSLNCFRKASKEQATAGKTGGKNKIRWLVSLTT